jgi:hypothetical protein
VSRYVKKADRLASETRSKLDAALQSIIDDPEASRDQKLAAAEKEADLVISDRRVEARTGPLKEIAVEDNTRTEGRTRGSEYSGD